MKYLRKDPSYQGSEWPNVNHSPKQKYSDFSTVRIYKPSKIIKVAQQFCRFFVWMSNNRQPQLFLLISRPNSSNYWTACIALDFSFLWLAEDRHRLLSTSLPLPPQKRDNSQVLEINKGKNISKCFSNIRLCSRKCYYPSLPEVYLQKETFCQGNMKNCLDFQN